MKLRCYTTYDYEAVDKLYRQFHENNFSIPNLHNTLRSMIVESDSNSVVAFGMLKLIPEAIMVLDLNQSSKVKSQALASLVRAAQVVTKSYDYKGFHAFVQGDFAQKLKEHFNFRPAVGEALVCDTEN